MATPGIAKLDVDLSPLWIFDLEDFQCATASVISVNFSFSDVSSDGYVASLHAPIGLSGTYEVKTEVEDSDGCCLDIADLKLDLRPDMSVCKVLQLLSQRWARFPIMDDFWFLHMSVDSECPNRLRVQLAATEFELDWMPWNPCEECRPKGLEYCHHHGLSGPSSDGG